MILLIKICFKNNGPPLIIVNFCKSLWIFFSDHIISAKKWSRSGENSNLRGTGYDNKNNFVIKVVLGKG